MIDHAVDVSRRDEKRQLRFAKRLKRRNAVPVRLRYDADAVAAAFEHARNDRSSKAGVVDIRVTRDKDKIQLIDASRAHLLAVDGRKGILLFRHIIRCFPAVSPSFRSFAPAPRPAARVLARVLW